MKKTVTIASAVVAGMLFSNVGLASNIHDSIMALLKKPGNDKVTVYWNAGYKYGETPAGEIKNSAPTTYSFRSGSDNFASDILSFDATMSFNHFMFNTEINHKNGINNSSRFTLGTKTKIEGQTVRLYVLTNKITRQAAFNIIGNMQITFNGATAIAETDLHHDPRTQVGLSISHQDGTGVDAAGTTVSAGADMIGASFTHKFMFGGSTPSVFLNLQGMAGHSGDNPILGGSTLNTKTQGLSASVFTQKRLSNGLFACVRATYSDRAVAGIKLKNQGIRISFGNGCPKRLADNDITYFS